MGAISLGLAAREVLRRYPLVPAGIELVSLGNHGGFSGAGLWRVEWTDSPLCLRAWPSGDPTPERLGQIHRLMRLALEAGIDSVPAIFLTGTGTTWVEHAGRLWEVTTWMPGRPSLCEKLTASRLQSACSLLARLHLVWARTGTQAGPCPAIQRRLACTREWIALAESGWQPRPASGAGRDKVYPLAERLWNLIRDRVREVPGKLAPWIARPFPIQPCLCDIRGEQFLFEEDRITGIIDFGSVKPDHVAVDLARLLGSLDDRDLASYSTREGLTHKPEVQAKDSPSLALQACVPLRTACSITAAGMQAYSRLRPLSSEEEALVGVLEETGTLLGAANWLGWLYRQKRSFEDWPAVARRLAELLERLERSTVIGH